MRRSTCLLLIGIELAVISWWCLNVRYETGIDALQYHRMANSIVQNGLAPWVVHPFSYIGIYPGSDSSGVPFLVASVSLLSGMGVQPTVLIYDGMLLLSFGLGLFAFIRRVTRRTDLALIAILMGSLAYGLFTTVTWSLDERSFNAAFAPLFLFVLLPGDTAAFRRTSKAWVTVLGLICFALLVSHLSFLLLLPFLVLVPLLTVVGRRAFVSRRRRLASGVYFGAVAASPLMVLAALSALGVLSDLGLQYQLESSALFKGSSPIIFLLNAIVFVATRIGPVNLTCAGLGFLLLASRPFLSSERIALGAFLVAGFLGLPIVLYSKDLLTPIFVGLGAIGLGFVIRQSGVRRILVGGLVTALVITGSIGFNAWNLARTSRTAAAVYWTQPGVTSEAQDANLWISVAANPSGCIYANNGVALAQVTVGPAEMVCSGIPIDFLLNMESSTGQRSSAFHVVFEGFGDVNPSNWFASPEITKMVQDFARLPSLDFEAGRSLLVEYRIRLILVDMQNPINIPLYSYEGTQVSPFFAGLWNELYPIYSTATYAVFAVS